MLNVISKYLLSCKKISCQLCKTKHVNYIHTCQKHYWCKNCNDYIKQYYGYGANRFCFLCRNPDWCKKIHVALENKSF